MIACRVLGPVEVSADGGPAPAELLWRKNLALLIYLARSPKRTRSRDHLVGLLWGDKPDSAARHSLNEAVRVLRKHVGADAIESEGEQVRLARGAIELDVDSLEARVAEKDWAAAASLVAGEFMEGFSVPGCSELEDWLHAERLALRQTSVDALVERASELLDSGQVRESMAVARRAGALDGTSEPAARVAMRASAIAGDRSGALAIYDALVRRLDEELGVEPDEETDGLAERVRRERIWKLPERVAAEEAAGESRRAPLVGREAELEELLQAWSDCVGRSKATVGMIDGDPGVGRTRLAEELLARARLDGAAVATARAVEADSAEAWSGIWALAGAIPLDAPGLEAAHPESLAVFAARLSNWADRFQADAAEEAPSPGRALIEVTRALTERQPVLLLVDDAAWLDRDTLLALGAALRDLKEQRLFLCIVSTTHQVRPELEEIRAHIGRELAGVTVKLGPLSHEALRRLARWALPSYDEIELDRVVRRVATDSAGLPLLAAELLGAVALGLDLGLTSGAWPQPLRTLDQTLPGELPDAVAGAVRVSFRRLTPDAQKTLTAAAVLDERVDLGTLAAVTGLDSEALTTAVDELEWARWLSADARGYSFVARIVREVVRRDMLTDGQRQRILEAAGQHA